MLRRGSSSEVETEDGSPLLDGRTDGRTDRQMDHRCLTLCFICDTCLPVSGLFPSLSHPSACSSAGLLLPHVRLPKLLTFPVWTLPSVTFIFLSVLKSTVFVQELPFLFSVLSPSSLPLFLPSSLPLPLPSLHHHHCRLYLSTSLSHKGSVY